MPKAPLHVVHVLEGFGGGIATYMGTVLPELVRGGFSVTLICSTTRGCPDATKRLDQLKSTGVNIVVLRIHREINPIKDLVAFARLFQTLKSLHANIVHTHCSKAGALGRIVATILRIPVRLHSPHCFAFLRCNSRLKAWAFLVVERLLGKLTTKIIAVGRAESAMAIKLGIVPQERCVTIENGLSETDTVSSVYAHEQHMILRKSMDIRDNHHVVVSICRLISYKGILRFLEAARQSHTTDTLFIIAGDGQLMAMAQRYIHDHHLTDKVRLLGYTDNIDHIYTIADLVVLCSDAEACPYVILEAMRAQRPIVATSVIGIKEHIRHNQTGILVRPSAKALASAIDGLLADKAKCQTISASAYEHFKTNYSLERQINNLSQLYQTSA